MQHCNIWNVGKCITGALLKTVIKLLLFLGTDPILEGGVGKDFGNGGGAGVVMYIAVDFLRPFLPMKGGALSQIRSHLFSKLGLRWALANIESSHPV